MPTPTQADRRIAIGETAAILGVTVDTVRLYEKQGKLTSERTPGNQRRFSLAAVIALRDAA